MDWGTSEQKTEVSVVLSKAFIIEVNLHAWTIWANLVPLISETPL